MKMLTIVLLCHDRPRTGVEALQSILEQTDKRFNILVSDNSSNEVFQEILRTDFPSIETIYWDPCFTSFIDHFNRIISIVKTKYVVLFHDDDVMEPCYVKKILDQFEKTPNVAAVSSNGYLIDYQSRKIKNKTNFKCYSSAQVFGDKVSLLNKYLVGDHGGVAPFGAYTYNLAAIRNIYLDPTRGRDYSDTIFLMEIVSRGGIVWVNQPLVKVRLHDEHISAYSGVKDYKCFIVTILKETKESIDQRYIDEYRFKNLLVALRKRKRWPFPALKFFIQTAPRLLIYSRTFRKKVISKLFRWNINSPGWQQHRV